MTEPINPSAAGDDTPGRPALDWVERANFLAIAKETDLGEGDEIAAATVDLMVEMETRIPAPWADTDPFVAERYLAARGASPAAATANAAEFEISMRALVGLGTGKPAETFDDIARWIETHVDGGEQ
ncbi:hypothetical protein [Actinacidiphila oryziradicis]|uniref:Uncharacterized protein n=1 Tax=Actinacidiphila oryziradicis TaxID=2571141 RepID=A0A4U0SNY2_9ACTN|nr:hypothetical protein [Actinacidiphila oryziradicis]TKA11734.1 hypothetical protein FCI23_10410 [Actinacidiphila oryziradicis]